MYGSNVTANVVINSEIDHIGDHRNNCPFKGKINLKKYTH